MFFEQYSHEPYVAVSRMILKLMPPEQRATREHQLPDLLARGNAALGVMETHLEGNEWFAGPRYSIADVALYAYTHEADEGGYEVAKYPAIGRWLKRVEEQPGHIPMDASW